MGDDVDAKAAKVLGWLTAAIMAVAVFAIFATGDVSFSAQRGTAPRFASITLCQC